MIRILIAHHSRLVCDTLRSALDKEEDVHIVGYATAVEELHFLLPHSNVVLLSAELKESNPLEILKEVRLTHPETKVLVMGVDEEPAAIIRYIESGASGYILQDESIEDMMQKLEAVRQEKAIISPSIAAVLMERVTQLANLSMPLSYMNDQVIQLNQLTSREDEILSLINEGCTNQEIADNLYIECGTVKNHVHNILKKLEVKNRHEAASIYQMNEQPVSSLPQAV
jgi:DNA-binding NarL/FixJ family response regulator